jgi:hypothetical protein
MGQPLRAWSSSGWQHLLFNWHKHACSEVVTVHFWASREFIGKMNVALELCRDVISGQDLHSAWRISQKGHDSFPVTR